MYAVFVLQLVHHEYAFYRRKILHRAKHIEHKLLVVFHIGGVDFQQVVEAAADIVAFGHFRYALHNLGEFGGDVAVQLPHLDVAEHHKALVEFGGVEYGDVFLDIASAFHSFQPFKHRGRRQVDLLREFLDCQAGIALQRA